MKRVLVAYEYSGRVREAFRARGFDAVSCDLLPSEDRSPHHHVGDVHPMLRWPWDLASPGPDRWKDRSRTYQGIADAMAAQWGPLI